jgi:hypothetical protein
LEHLTWLDHCPGTGEASEQKTRRSRVLKKVLPFLIAALLIPGAALAKGPKQNNGSNSAKGRAKVMYVLHGTLSGYSAYDSATPADGSITIHVLRSNRHGKLLRDSDQTFVVGAKTKIRVKHGLSVDSTGCYSGVVKVRAPRVAFKDPTAQADLATALQDATAFQVMFKSSTTCPS